MQAELTSVLENIGKFDPLYLEKLRNLDSASFLILSSIYVYPYSGKETEALKVLLNMFNEQNKDNPPIKLTKPEAISLLKVLIKINKSYNVSSE